MAHSAISKRLKLSSTYEKDVIDRISDLPDCILSYILSLMPTRYAVRTSILSTRWKFLWTYIINLDFDNEIDPRNKKNNRREKEKMFKHFVYRVLLLLKQQRMHKFRLDFEEIGHNTFCHVNNWVSSAIERGVEELDLKGFYSQGRLLESELLCRLCNCKTLKVLKLYGRWYLDLSNYSVSFPSLKILHLINVIYEDEESVRKLFNCCPVLEDLVIENCVLERGSKFHICCSSLIRLKLHFFDITSMCNVLVINTPALKYLDLNGGLSPQILVMDMVSLADAKIDVRIWKNQEDHHDNILLEIFNAVSNMKFLSLSRLTMEALSLASDQFVLPKFDNLIRLSVNFKSKSREWKPLSSLLANSVNLENFICNEDYEGL